MIDNEASEHAVHYELLMTDIEDVEPLKAELAIGNTVTVSQGGYIRIDVVAKTPNL